METNNIYTLSHGVVPVPNKWIIPGISHLKGNKDAFKYVIEMVCKKYGQTEKAIMSKSRKREIVKSRQIVMSLIKTNFYKLSLSAIGNRCGGKDHATVIHSCNAVQNQIDTDKNYREEYEEFDVMIKSNINMFKQTHLKWKNKQFS